ncbi:MAG: hypothetical protein ACREMY_22350, partial [bacterium]
ARETAAPVRLVTPRAGARLVADSTAKLEWAPLARFDGLGEPEEWEAFLSLDGGATYPVRLTPHLDVDLRSIRFQVPSIPTANARILLRFGDERGETAIELPERIAIVAASPVEAPAQAMKLLRARRAFEAGEPALPGQAGVVSWVEGSRRGGDLRQVVAAESPGLQARPELAAGHAEDAVLGCIPAPRSSRDSTPSHTAFTYPLVCRHSPLSRAGSDPSGTIDILLLTQRQNE